MAEEAKNLSVNASVIDGDETYAHETAINFGPLQFILDFKTVTPRVDPRANIQENQAQVVIRHNVVMIDPFHAKVLAQIMNDTIKKYEQQFGTIEKPKALVVMEKKMQGGKKGYDKNLSYLG